MLVEAACSVQRHHAHEVRPTVQKGLGLGTTRGASIVYATAPSNCKVGKQIDLRELVYLMNGTRLRIAL